MLEAVKVKPRIKFSVLSFARFRRKARKYDTVGTRLRASRCSIRITLKLMRMRG